MSFLNKKDDIDIYCSSSLCGYPILKQPDMIIDMTKNSQMHQTPKANMHQTQKANMHQTQKANMHQTHQSNNRHVKESFTDEANIDPGEIFSPSYLRNVLNYQDTIVPGAQVK